MTEVSLIDRLLRGLKNEPSQEECERLHRSVKQAQISDTARDIMLLAIDDYLVHKGLKPLLGDTVAS